MCFGIHLTYHACMVRCKCLLHISVHYHRSRENSMMTKCIEKSAVDMQPHWSSWYIKSIFDTLINLVCFFIPNGPLLYCAHSISLYIVDWHMRHMNLPFIFDMLADALYHTFTFHIWIKIVVVIIARHG